MQINKIRCFVHILVKILTYLTNSQNQREKYHFSIDKFLYTLYNNNSKEQPLFIYVWLILMGGESNGQCKTCKKTPRLYLD